MGAAQEPNPQSRQPAPFQSSKSPLVSREAFYRRLSSRRPTEWWAHLVGALRVYPHKHCQETCNDLRAAALQFLSTAIYCAANGVDLRRQVLRALGAHRNSDPQEFDGSRTGTEPTEPTTRALPILEITAGESRSVLPTPELPASDRVVGAPGGRTSSLPA